MKSFDPETLAFYEAEAPDYAASGRNGVARHLPDFLDRLMPGASILELGCGGGVDAAYMIDRGFVVEPTDGAAAMARKAEERLGRPVRVMRFDELEAIAIYDAVVASASLLHAPLDLLQDILAKIWRALKPHGWHTASFKAGGGEGRDSLGRYYNYPDRAALERIYRKAGAWNTLEIESYAGGGYDGKQGPWLRITVQKAD